MNCHQKSERSWEVNNNQLPVCTRDVGIFAGLFIGGMVFSRRGWNRWTVRDTCLSLLPESMLHGVYAKNQRTLLWLACGLLLCAPLIADGFLQLLTPYESTNFKRVLTGVPFGFGLGILLCSMFAARAEAFLERAKCFFQVRHGLRSPRTTLTNRSDWAAASTTRRSVQPPWLAAGNPRDRWSKFGVVH